MIQFRAPASSAMDGRTFNCFVAGDENAGKTSLIRRILGGDFDSDHTKTQSIHEYVKTFASSAGTIKFRLFDFPADKHLHGVADLRHCNENAHCFIAMVDGTSFLSIKRAEALLDRFSHPDNDLSNTPIAFCVNKLDINTTPSFESIKALDKLIKRQRNLKLMRVFTMSAKDNTATHEPFLFFAQQLTGIDHLTIEDDKEDDKDVHEEEEEEEDAEVLQAVEALLIGEAPTGGNEDEVEEWTAANAVRGRLAADIVLRLSQMSSEKRAACVQFIYAISR